MGVQTQTRFDTTLNGAITDVQVTATLDAAPAQTTGYGTFERGEANEEDIYWGNLAGLQLTGLLRGLSQTSLVNLEVAGNKKAHVDGVQFEGTLLHYIINNKTDVDDNETVTGDWDFNVPPEAGADPSDNNDLTRKSWVDTQLALKGNLAGGNVWAGVQTFADDSARSTTNAAPVNELSFANKKYVDDQISGVADVNVRVSADDTTPGNLEAKITAGTHISLSTNNPAGNENRQISTDAVQSSSGAADANKLIATNASGVIDNSFFSSPAPVRSYVALEAVTQNDAVCIMPNQVQYYSQLSDTNLALGNANAQRRFAIKIVPAVTSNTLTTMQFRAAEQVNASTTLGDLDISFQGDNGGEPDGVDIANGAANAITQVTQRTWNTTQADRTATWASSPTLTSGTTYWLVWAVNATDAANYLNLSTNAVHDENYVTYTRLTYDLDAGTWGNSTTNSTPWFWFNNQLHLLGTGVVPTDANFGGRSWGFKGFAKANAVANANVDVYYDIAPSQTGLNPKLPYYLSTTAGGLTTTPPDNEYDHSTPNNTVCRYKVAEPESSTALRVDRGNKIVAGHKDGITATETQQFIFWRRPELVTYQAIVDDSGAGNNESFSSGFFTGNIENTLYTDDQSASPVNTSVFKAATAGTLYFSGDAGSVTDIGYTLTVTENADTKTLSYQWVAWLA